MKLLLILLKYINRFILFGWNSRLSLSFFFYLQNPYEIGKE